MLTSKQTDKSYNGNGAVGEVGGCKRGNGKGGTRSLDLAQGFVGLILRRGANHEMRSLRDGNSGRFGSLPGLWRQPK
jgi:hypothetical protein